MSRDYILRLAETVGAMLAAILDHRKAGRVAEAHQEVERRCLQTIGLPLDVVRQSSPEVLWERLRQSGGLMYARAIMLGELLLQDAELFEAANRPADSYCSRLQALGLLTESIDRLGHEEAAMYRMKVEALARSLEAFRDDPSVEARDSGG